VGQRPGGVPTRVQGPDPAKFVPIGDLDGDDPLAGERDDLGLGTPMVSSTPREVWSSPMTPPACGTALGVAS